MGPKRGICPLKAKTPKATHEDSAYHFKKLCNRGESNGSPGWPGHPLPRPTHGPSQNSVAHSVLSCIGHFALALATPLAPLTSKVYICPC